MKVFHVNCSLENFRLQYKIRKELHIYLGQMKLPDCLRAQTVRSHIVPVRTSF